eukprot:2976951-Rhodomonas_salina.2
MASATTHTPPQHTHSHSTRNVCSVPQLLGSLNPSLYATLQTWEHLQDIRLVSPREDGCRRRVLRPDRVFGLPTTVALVYERADHRVHRRQILFRARALRPRSASRPRMFRMFRARSLRGAFMVGHRCRERAVRGSQPRTRPTR